MGFSWASVSLAGEIHPSRAGVVTLPYFCGDVLSGSEIETSTRLRDRATLWTVIQALRHQASMAPSQSYGLMTLPPDATVKQQAQPVVAEVAEAVPDPLDLLDQQVHGLGRAVGAAAGGVEGEDFSLPRPDGTGKARQLRHPDVVRPAVEAPQRGPGVGQVAGGVDSAQQLLALPGDRYLAGRIPGGQPSPQPHPSPAGELLCGGQQRLADAVQRIAFASPVPEGGLLGPPADLVDHQVGQPD